MMYRNLGDERSSDLIRSAVVATVHAWIDRYGTLPLEDLRTEIDADAVRSDLPGYSYRRAGWRTLKRKGRMLYLRCPRTQIDAAAATHRPRTLWDVS
jgi:hypothetical protein